MAQLCFLILILSSLFAGHAYCNKEIKIVSLAPSVTESLYLLGAQDNIAGVTVYCPAPDKEKVGTLIEPNIEKISSLNPDLVILSTEGNPPSTLEKLNSLKIKTLVLGPDRSFQDIRDDFYKLGKAVNKEKEAGRILSDAKTRIDSIRSRIKGTKKIKVFFQLGMQPLVTTGGASYINELIEFAGGENIFSDINSGYARVNKEEVIKRNPDAIVIVPMAGEDDFADIWGKFNTINAVKNKKVYLLSDDSFLKPTPPAFLSGLVTLSRLLHPEQFNEHD